MEIGEVKITPYDKLKINKKGSFLKIINVEKKINTIQ